jgi:acyl dehydratase
MKYFEDIEIGERAVIGSHMFSAAEIKAYAERFDPQPDHLDEDAATRSPAGRLCASGWHIGCIYMRLSVEYRRREAEALQARGEPVATMGISPGFRNLTWPNPVFAGDTVTYTTEIMQRRPSINRPSWGLLTLRNTGANQNGNTVISFFGTAFVARRKKAESPA